MADSISPERRRLFVICGWAVIILLYVAIRINLVDIPLDRDEGAFGYMGQLILNHQLPYKDGMDHKPPVVFYLYAIALLFIRPTPGGVHLFLHIYNFITLIALSLLAKTYFKSSAAAMWSAFVYAVFSASPVIQGFTASTEMFMLLPITLSVLFAVLAVRGKSASYALLSGLCGALACWTKQVAFFNVAFVLIYLVAAFHAQKTDWRRAGRYVMWWCIGAIGISLLISGYFLLKGIFDEFFYWSFTHNLYYSARIASEEKASWFFDWLGDFLREDSLLLGVGLLYSIFIAVKKDTRGYFTLGFFLSSFLGTLPGFAYRHYFAQLAPAIALSGGLAISEIIHMIRGAKGKAAAVLICATLVIGIPLAVNRDVYLETDPNKISRDFFGLNPFPESVDIAAFISRHSTPHDSVFILGSEPQILFYSERRSATPFVMIYPLTFVHPGYREMQQSAWKDIMTNQPKFILFTLIPTSILWDEKADLSFTSNIETLVERDYRLAERLAIGGTYAVLLYEKTGQGSEKDTLTP